MHKHICIKHSKLALQKKNNSNQSEEDEQTRVEERKRRTAMTISRIRMARLFVLSGAHSIVFGEQRILAFR